MHPPSTAIEQKRPNAINSSPAEILPTRMLRVETACQRLKTPDPCAAPRSHLGQSLSEGFLGVLVLARPSAREDGTIQNQNARIFPRIFPWKSEISIGEPKEIPRKHRDTGTARQSQCRTTGLMRSERRSQD